MARIFITLEEAKEKLGLAENPMIDVMTESANIIVDNYVDEAILETNQLARLGVLKYIEFMNNRKAGIKSVTDIDISYSYDLPTSNNLPTFIAELLAPIKKVTQAANGFTFL